MAQFLQHSTFHSMGAQLLGLFLALLLLSVRSDQQDQSDQGTDSSDTSTAASNEYASNSGVPRLRYLSLRSGDRPIDLSPVFTPNHFIYEASLDFYLSSFAIDAGGDSGMEIVNVEDLQTNKDILPGAKHRIAIKVRATSTQAEMSYTVDVSRFDGKDVAINSCEVPGAVLSPMFVPDLTDYYVKVPAEQDHVKIRFIPWDTGQTFDFSAWNMNISLPPTAAPTATNSRTRKKKSSVATSSSTGDTSDQTSSTDDGARRLEEHQPRQLSQTTLAGEVQHMFMDRQFPIEVGGSRLITIVVHPANGDPALSRTYSLKCLRGSCPSYRPLYAPDMRKCAITCNEGYFPVAASSRCDACSPHCLKCSSWNGCQLCEPSQWRVLYIVRAVGGHCEVVRVPWLTVLLSLAALIICCSVSSCLCCGSCSRSRSRGKKVGGIYRPKATGTDEDMQQSHRLLPRDGEPRYFEEDFE